MVLLEVLLTIGIVVTIVVLGLLLLAAWLGISALRLVGRMVRWAVTQAFGLGGRPMVLMSRCARATCGELNPTEARFCRRCGRAIAGVDGRHLVEVPTEPVRVDVRG